MITKENLSANLELLRLLLPDKPVQYVTDYPKTLSEALTKYSNQRSVNRLQLNTKSLNKLNWPLPLWVDPIDIKIGFKNERFWKKYHADWYEKSEFKGFKSFDWLYVAVFGNSDSKRSVDEILVEIFDLNLKYIENRFIDHPLLLDKNDLISEIFTIYKRKYWSSCISTIFPLVDYVIRRLLKTNNLSKSVTTICNLFRDCGFGVNEVQYLMPHATLIEFLSDDNQPFNIKFNSPEYHNLQEKVKNNDYGIIGPALSSFLLFSNNYYGYYKEDKNQVNILNRHAIIHGSVNAYNNKLNTVKLLTYFYLVLELQPAFDILFKEK